MAPIARMKRQSSSLLRTSLAPTEEYVQSTTAPFIKRGMINWDQNGNRIVNGNYSGIGDTIFYVSDDSYAQLLLSDMFAFRREPKSVPGWSKLALCYVLAVLRNDKEDKAETNFQSGDCDTKTMFKIGVFKGSAAVKWERMNHCYMNDPIVNAYARCLIVKTVGKVGTFEENHQICDKVKGNDEFLNDEFGSHVREVCYTNADIILDHFEMELGERESLHEVRPFDLELCALQTYFRAGKMTLCFPDFGPIFKLPKHTSYSSECGYGSHQILTIEYLNPNTLNVIFGRDRFAKNAQMQIRIDLALPAERIVCKRLVFNRYESGTTYHFVDRQKGSLVSKYNLPADLIPVPAELLTVYGTFGLVSDEVKVVIVNSFENTFFFLRLGMCPNTIKCYWSFTPSIHRCINIHGNERVDCSIEVQTSITTSTGSESSFEFGTEKSTGIAAEIQLTKEVKLGATHQSSTRTNAVQKFVQNILKGKQITTKVPLYANPGQIVELWQETFTCLNHRYYLPVYVPKEAASAEISNFPEMTVGGNHWREKEDFGINGEDLTANLPITPYDDILAVDLHKGICDFPLNPAYNESKCNYFKIPQDLFRTMEEVMLTQK